jgi:hypothetical protein
MVESLEAQRGLANPTLDKNGNLWRFTSTLGKIRIGFDLANLLNMSLRMRGDFEHPLPAIDRVCGAKAVGAQVVVG